MRTFEMTAERLIRLGAGLQRLKERIYGERWAFWIQSEDGWVKYVDTEEGKLL